MARKIEPPVQCPKCRSPYWAKERIVGKVIRLDPEEYAKLRKAANIRPARKLKPCPSCGGLNGLHQKGCKA